MRVLIAQIGIEARSAHSRAGLSTSQKAGSALVSGILCQLSGGRLDELRIDIRMILLEGVY